MFASGVPVGGKESEANSGKVRGMKQDAWWPRIVAAEQPNKNYDDNHQASVLRRIEKRMACHSFGSVPKRRKHNKIRGLLAFRHCFRHNSRHENAVPRHFDLTYCGPLAKLSSESV